MLCSNAEDVAKFVMHKQKASAIFNEVKISGEVEAVEISCFYKKK